MVPTMVASVVAYHTDGFEWSWPLCCLRCGAGSDRPCIISTATALESLQIPRGMVEILRGSRPVIITRWREAVDQAQRAEEDGRGAAPNTFPSVTRPNPWGSSPD
jgi:hypothetical protein